MRPLGSRLQHNYNHSNKSSFTFSTNTVKPRIHSYRLRITTMSEQNTGGYSRHCSKLQGMWRVLYFLKNVFICDFNKNNLPNCWTEDDFGCRAGLSLPVWEGKGRRFDNGTLYITGKAANQASSLWRFLNGPPMTVSISHDANNGQANFLFYYLYFIIPLNDRMASDVNLVWRYKMYTECIRNIDSYN